MRVLLSAYACRPNAGSEPGCGWNWATHLAARGIQVHVLVAQRNREAIEAGLKVNPHPNLHFNYVSVPAEWVKKYESLHYVCWQVVALKIARKLVRELRIPIAHHVTYASVHVPSQLWRLGIPVVFGPVGGGQTAPAEMLTYFGNDSLKERRRSFITRALRFSPFHRRWLRRMNFILAANSDTLNLVQSMGCQSAQLMCDTAMPLSYFAERPIGFEQREPPLKLLWVGRMLRRKALPLALDALKEARADATLTIAGDGMEPHHVRQAIAERNLQQRVFWKGSRLSWGELREAYAGHDAMLFTSLRDSFGSQVLEAMAMGLPVITLDLNGAHDFVPDGASLKVRVGGPEETVGGLARAIENYASISAHERAEMSKQAWEFARTLTWAARAEFAEDLYRQILSKRTHLENASASEVATVEV